MERHFRFLRDIEPQRIVCSMMTLRLLQLNIERSKHFDRVLPFLQTHTPEVLCIQEIYEHDVPRFEALGYHAYFAATNIRKEGVEEGAQGVALFSTLPMQKTWTAQYGGTQGALPIYQGETPEAKHDTQRFVATFTEVQKDGKVFRNVAKQDEKMNALQGQVQMHEKNISALKIELSKISN